MHVTRVLLKYETPVPYEYDTGTAVNCKTLNHDNDMISFLVCDVRRYRQGEQRPLVGFLSRHAPPPTTGERLRLDHNHSPYTYVDYLVQNDIHDTDLKLMVVVKLLILLTT